MVNGNLEAGSAGWFQYSNLGYPVICNASNCGAALGPHSGQTLAWLGGSNNERSRISQTVTLPAGENATFSYYYRIESQDRCGYDVGYVRLAQGSVINALRSYTLCTTSAGGWKLDTLDLSSYAGRQVRLEFYGVTDRLNVSNFFVDDISVQIGESCAVGSAAAAASAPGEVTTDQGPEPPTRADEPPLGDIRHRR
jgi:hypothetical protein